MRLFLLTTLAMIALAANSVLNRMAIVQAGLDPVLLGIIRLTAGAVVLATLVLWQKRGFALGGRSRLSGVGGLLVYIFGFSIAYQSMDTGAGALLLFGVVQITMFAAAVLRKDDMPLNRWLGAGLAFAGLAWLLWPSGDVIFSLPHAVSMALAGVGWGIYSLAGQTETDATQATAMNFILAAPLSLLALLVLAVDVSSVNALGVGLAVASGAITSGMGYALWYALIPTLGASKAAVTQLTVPIIATLGGLVTLGEPITLKLTLASAIVLGGVWLSLLKLKQRATA